MLRGDRILQMIEAQTLELNFDQEPLFLDTLSIKSISAHTGIAPNNISTELGRLFRAGELIRVGGHPVYYLSKQVLQKRTLLRFEKNSFAQVHDLQLYLKSITTGAKYVSSRLDGLIGARQSLALPVKQAKAAVRYPPHGLHTLITGPTGVGKSLFAQCMYDYARDSRLLAPDARLITLNCANYAENPQLLLSQLFGYVKGAFTGANSDHKGMVEYASGGILFLDEIHRLNPEGQEKLFRLIDYGKYSRLGETGAERIAQVLIIGATTEDTPSSMLGTFLRRIPVHIELPPLNCRSIDERLELVLHSFWREAQNIQSSIELNSEILHALCFYNCPANLGQLATDIKITCANAYFEHNIFGAPDPVKIEVHHLNQKIIEGLFVMTNRPSTLVLQRLQNPQQPIRIAVGCDFDAICRQYFV